ncbi:MAG TPA: carbamoyltransferase HypF, partial [Dissulfurispiraceae bacterium]|nr:carbamoyltransferase HypF [Dissulfurispiraceae bacterium]
MAAFAMCEQCSAEYYDPLDRRFHAQPNACPDCGPHVSFLLENSDLHVDERKPIEAAKAIIRQGGIVAVKGLGGFHLCCDAVNAEAVEKLRTRKRRLNKPFALMSGRIEDIRKYCEISTAEESLLSDRRRPIVLLRKRKDCSLPYGLAPSNATLGFMLPYAPLHYLLFTDERGAPGAFPALVMTSANLSEEPIVIGNEEARDRLTSIADAFLFHNRDIFMRVDDSVVRIVNNTVRFIRRSRGYAPEALSLGKEMPDLLAVGAEVKNTLAISKGSYAIVSQHIGDMENYETLRFFEETLENLKQVYRSDPIRLAHDLHPGYLSTRWAVQQCEGHGVPCDGVQHHHAHIAAVMAEHGLHDPVIGVALDGTGYGTDSIIWGSEFLVCTRASFERAAHFAALPLPGGEAAIREGWRIAAALLQQSLDDVELWSAFREIGFVERYGEARLKQVLQIASDSRFSPRSCGAGRYFDAAAALAGVCDKNTFEGEAAIALESIITDDGNADDHYGYSMCEGSVRQIDFSPMVRSLIADVIAGIDSATLARRFHQTIINSVIEMVDMLSAQTGITHIALSGGVFQNAYLSVEIERRLSDRNLKVFLHERVPCNDACLSLGQLAVLAARLK